MPKISTLFCLVDIKKHSFVTCCVFLFASVCNGQVSAEGQFADRQQHH